MPDLTADERAILNVLAAAQLPVSLDGAFEILLPPRPRLPRQGGRRVERALDGDDAGVGGVGEGGVARAV